LRVYFHLDLPAHQPKKSIRIKKLIRGVQRMRRTNVEHKVI